MNRLKDQTSPYLKQHENNPVDWYPWGEEAFQHAREQNKPILLSVGYSACHWCHVMAHESFEHEETAQIMNALYINVKVDREERPDVDAIYMEAVQALTGSGGWPMTVFLLPDGRPFFGGTYFPLEPRMGMSSFRQILHRVHDAYVNRYSGIEAAARGLTERLKRDLFQGGGDADMLNDDLLEVAITQMTTSFDRNNGGFGGAPKFPQPMGLEFLLRQHARTGDVSALRMVTHTLYKMARGGIYDQIGGGFARYSVDALWLVPHFEKMLYDNAQLSRVYLHAWQATGDDFLKRIAEEVYDYILREMTAPEGGFYSATDADSEGEEGKFFVWTAEEIAELLNADDYRIAVAYWDISATGNFEGKSILYVPEDDETIADELDISVAALQERIAAIKDTLYAARTHRVHPALDDKILSAWNGLMLASLAEAARVLERDDYRQAAIRCAEFLLANLRTAEGRLLRTYKDGHAKLNGYLEDYANMIDALIEMYQLTFDPRWFTAACELADATLTHFAAPEGGFYDTSDDHEVLVVRPRSVQDNATPSGNSMIVHQLLRLAAYTGEARYEQAARDALGLLAELLKHYPQAFGEALNAVSLIVAGMHEVAIIGDPQADDTRQLLRVLHETYRPHLVIALSETGAGEDAAVPLLRGRDERDNMPTAYVCRRFACQLPVHTADDLRQQLSSEQ